MKVRSPHVPRRSRSVAATAASGSESTSAGPISQRAPPRNAPPTRPTPQAITRPATAIPPPSALPAAAAAKPPTESASRTMPIAIRAAIPDDVARAVVAHDADQHVEDHAGDQQDPQLGAPEPVRHEDGDRGDGEQAGAQRAPEAPLERLGVGVVGGEQDEAGEVREQAEAAGEGEDHERDPDRERVDAEVLAEAAGDAADHRVGRRPRQARPRGLARLVRLWLRLGRPRLVAVVGHLLGVGLVGHGSPLGTGEDRHSGAHRARPPSGITPRRPLGTACGTAGPARMAKSVAPSSGVVCCEGSHDQ